LLLNFAHLSYSIINKDFGAVDTLLGAREAWGGTCWWDGS